MRGDEGGTRSGRFSSSYPNLQNIPSRDDELAPIIRGLFIPDEGHPYWRRYDYSQIEYRFLIHYATGAGANEARELFNRCPDTDYHDMTQELVRTQAGIELARKPTKNLNFGIVFGMGEERLMAQLGVDLTKARHLLEAYHKGMPFVRPTMDAHMKEAQSTGIIRTILGRRSRFDLFGPRRWQEDQVPYTYHKAREVYGPDIIRAFTHKALNRRLQGSAADLIKKAMYRCWVDGVFAETGIPRLTVHDELDFSDPGGREDAFREMQHIMETAIPIRIPIRADGDIGPDWGHGQPIDQKEQTGNVA
jgi:DNA polymerase-1